MNGKGYEVAVIVYTVSGLVAVAVTITQVGAVAQLRVKWVFNASAQIGSEILGATAHQGCQTVWDIDGDGVDEIVFGTPWGESKRLWCIGTNGAFRWSYPPMDQDGLPGNWISKVSLIDLDRDGRYELCFAGGGRLHVLDGTGQIIWSWDNPNVGTDILGPPQAYDVDGDGFVDFFVADLMGCVYRLTHEGRLVWSEQPRSDTMDRQTMATASWPDAASLIQFTPFTSFSAEQPTIADIDRDGGYELLVATGHGWLYCLDAKTGNQKWRFKTSASIRNPPIVADVNRDSEYEALVWSEGSLAEGSTLFCVSFYGAEIWSLTLPGKEHISLVQQVMQSVGDFDGDGSMDMAVMVSADLVNISSKTDNTSDSVVYIIDIGESENVGYVIDIGGAVPRVKYALNFTEMSLKGTIPPGGMTNRYSSYQLVADIDGDNKQEILWLAPYPIVTDAATGALEAYYTKDDMVWGFGRENGGWWGDVDRDGRSEWICGADGAWCMLTGCHQQTQVYCLTMDGKFPADSWWPEYYHTACPVDYQNVQDWLGLKAAYSNSLWFPMDELLLAGFLVLVARALVRRSLDG